MRKVIISVLFIFLLSSVSYADMYLFGYTPGGRLGGGLRFDVSENVVADFSLSADSGDSVSEYQLYADVFFGNWGVGLTAKKPSVDEELSYNISLQYAVEQAVTEGAALGVLVILADYDTATGLDPNMHFGSAIVPYFVLAL